MSLKSPPPNPNLPPQTDLSALTSSAALFSSAQHTLPQLRAIHGALHTHVADVSARLRTQVGASYRDLLGTADTIVAMRSDMDEVLGLLGGMGGRCGRGVVGGKGKGLRGFMEYTTGTGGGKGDVGERARGRLLGGCLLGLEGVLRHKEVEGRGERLVLAARLYVLGRLLVKSLGVGEGEAARKSLEGVQKGRLMAGVNAVLRSGGARAMREGDVLRALSAYCLAESAGARDVLRYFLRVRSEAISLALEDEDDRAVRNPKDVIRALGLYTKTLQDVQALVPQKLTDALVALKKDRLLENVSLKQMEGLRLDIYKRWCGDEIQFYTPFIRHDDLDVKQAREMLTSWASSGSKVLLQGLEKTLESMTEFKAIVDLRTSVLKLWIAEGGKARGFDPSIMLDQLREAINKHMLRVLEAKVTKLRLVGSEVSATLDAWREGTTDRHQSLWDADSFDTDPSDAAQFTHDVVARLYGRNDAVSKAVTSYKSWFHVIDDVGQVVDQLKRQRWDNDVDEIEDEETIEERQQLLATDDPLALSQHLTRLLVEAFKRLDDQLTTLWNAQREGPNNGAVAMYFLRLLRDVRARLPDIAEVKSFGLAVVPSLHEALAATVVVSSLDEFATVALARKTVVGRSLWEGEPALPGSPSPGTFKFLRNLTTAMGDAGGDLWSPAAVGALKRHLSKQVYDAWLEALGTLDGDSKTESVDEAKDTDKQESGEEGPEKEAGGEVQESLEHHDLLVQWLLDIHYLRAFIAPHPASDEEHLKKLEETISQKTGLESPAQGRLAKASQDYFKRTGLLFGLLT